MKIYNILILFYVFVSVFLGIMILSFSLHLIDINEIVFQVNEIYNNTNARLGLAASGIFFILLSLLFAQIISGRHEREKTIAFNNPSGQVTITLFAVEDLIRRIGQELPQIKEIRPDVVATKKRGIQVKIRLVLKSETNIPEFTTQLQEIVKNRIQEILGIEEEIVVKIHIAKIFIQQEKKKRRIEEASITDTEQEVQVPYQRI